MENINLEITQKKEPAPHPLVKLLAGVVLVSFIFGVLGGMLGGVYLIRLPQVQKILNNNNKNSQVNSFNQNQKIILTEDSAIIDVVKKAGPAVVSIVISKDLNKIPGYSLNPFEDDPFFNFFYGSRQNQKPSGPNIQQIGAGTGFFVTSDGLILTNKHVVEDEQASYTVLTQDGTKYEAKVLARDPVNDLAIVKIEIKNAGYLELSDSSRLQVGERVIAIGNSLGQYQNTVTSGIVSGIGRKITAGSQGGSEELSGVIQTDAAINPGNSGGPLLNVLGQVIGINTAIDSQGQLVGFAIPSNDAQKALAAYQKNGKITRPFLGIRYIMITKELATQEKLPESYGALILRGTNRTDFAVIPGSPADKAGLVENDIILEVNGKKLEGDNNLNLVLKDLNVGDSLNMKVYHKGEEKNVEVILGESK